MRENDVAPGTVCGVWSEHKHLRVCRGGPRGDGSPPGGFGHRGLREFRRRGCGEALGLFDLDAVLHVLRPVGLLAGLVAVVCVPAAVVLSLFGTVATL